MHTHGFQRYRHKYTPRHTSSSDTPWTQTTDTLHMCLIHTYTSHAHTPHRHTSHVHLMYLPYIPHTHSTHLTHVHCTQTHIMYTHTSSPTHFTHIHLSPPLTGRHQHKLQTLGNSVLIPFHQESAQYKPHLFVHIQIFLELWVGTALVLGEPTGHKHGGYIFLGETDNKKNKKTSHAVQER